MCPSKAVVNIIITLTYLIYTSSAFSVSPSFGKRVPSGGRAPIIPDNIDSKTSTSTSKTDDKENNKKWEATPIDDNSSEAKLIVLQITDVYTLDQFAHFKTLLEETRSKAKNCEVVCMLTGDFLSPYLLSSVDNGYGMMNALSKVPMDYITWGNHEADIEHNIVCNHVKAFHKTGGKWINSNMIDHEAMDCQQEYDVIEIASPDGTNKRKVGLCAVLSDDPNLYSQFEEPGAFGGATITNPWDALRKYEKILKDDHQCDMVLPLQHTYVPDDHKTCKDFDFPVILSGHDHHKVDEVVHGTRLIKPGMNGIHATVLEISWPNSIQESNQPTITSRFVKTDDWEPDPILAEECERAYDALAPLRNTELAEVPAAFEPLSSGDSRGSVCTMGKLICTLLKSSMNVSRKYRKHVVDAVLLMGGNIRGNAEYEEGSFFSMETLEAEIKSDEVVAVVPMPGWLLAEGVAETHSGEPIPGWMQHDDGIQEDYSSDDGKPVVTHVAGKLIDHDRIYRVATKISDLTNGQCASWTEYYTQNSHLLPPKGAYVNIHAELMSHFARNLWKKLYLAVSAEGLNNVLQSRKSTAAPSPPVVEGDELLEALDSTGDGVVTVNDIQNALHEYLGYSVDSKEVALAKFMISFANTNVGGSDDTITKQELDKFCEKLSEESLSPSAVVNKHKKSLLLGDKSMESLLTEDAAVTSSHMILENEIAQAILKDARTERGATSPNFMSPTTAATIPEIFKRSVKKVEQRLKMSSPRRPLRALPVPIIILASPFEFVRAAVAEVMDMLV